MALNIYTRKEERFPLKNLSLRSRATHTQSKQKEVDNKNQSGNNEM